MKESQRGQVLALWLRLAGFALVPMALQGISPMAGAATRIFATLALSYGTARRGIYEGIAAVAFVAVMTAVFVAPDVSLFFVLETLPICLAVRLVVHSKAPMHESVLKGTGVIVLLFGVAAVAYSAATGTTVAGLYEQMMQASREYLAPLTQNGDMSPAVRNQTEYIMGLWQAVFPGFVLANMMVMLVVYSVLSRTWMIAAGLYDPAGMPLMSQWRMPFYFVWAFIAMAVAILLGQGALRGAALNLLLPLGVLYSMQGLAVLGHLARKWMIPPFFRTLLVVFAILSFSVVFVMILALMGLFDTWFDIRRRFPLATGGPPEA